ncbi:MAG TPA: TIR domain-containing protein [Bacteroidia bacterium]|nr:TIR domain-containing protein [Bacteroidia bacterium]
METPKAYISFDYEKYSNEQAQFLDLLKKSNIELVIDSYTCKPTLPENQWNNVVSDKINYVNMLIVLISSTSAQLKSTQKEIQAAQYQNIPVFGVYIAGANNTTALPTGIPRERVVNLVAADISSKIKKAMTEGKNEMLTDKASGGGTAGLEFGG